MLYRALFNYTKTQKSYIFESWNFWKIDTLPTPAYLNHW